jgi:hypothetical protein
MTRLFCSIFYATQSKKLEMAGLKARVYHSGGVQAMKPSGSKKSGSGKE